VASICLAGIWHQGAVLAACFADMGHDVRVVAGSDVVAGLSSSRAPVREPLLPALLRRTLKSGRLRLFTDFADGLDGADFAYIALDVPVLDDDSPDLEPVYELAEQIGTSLRGDAVLCVTAQVPVGTTADLGRVVRDRAGSMLLDVAYVPEFLRVGDAVRSFRHADRIVIGAAPATAARVAALYRPLGRPLVLTDVLTAELAKHASNAFLATSISFINEIADISRHVGANVDEVAAIMKLDRRIGRHAFLDAGLGYGGGTLAREIRTLQRLGADNGVATTLADAVDAVNGDRPTLVRRALTDELGRLDGRRVTLLGLTYKPGTSTMRRAISLAVARDLAAQGADVVGFDPLANVREIDPALALDVRRDPHAAADGADALVLITQWDGLRTLDVPRLRSAMRGDLFLDTRGAVDRELMAAAGFRYVRI
jgi:UDPglucose 6-dehydrogenase